ncbi:MAG: hypothetical protein O3B74_13120 [Proteobacteria bacterium]|nr:hypothetical protein [Pseudomonadota bacterium]MDA1309076.1 hypothetical protein [Pseudomonadota bacterium]
MNVGEHEASIPLDSVCQEFKIDPGSPDGEMLEQVAQGLKYVKDIRPGDTIPRELLDGTASWSIDESHGVIARNKLLVSVAAFGGGKEKAKVNLTADELARTVQNPETRKLIDLGLDKVSVALGIGKARRHEVEDLIHRIARELAYIEALRDRYTHVSEIVGKLDQVGHLYTTDRAFLDEINRVKVLMGPPIKDFRKFFHEADNRTNDVVAMLKSFSQQLIDIRKMRDELHQRMLIWDEAIEHWEFDLSYKSKASRGAVQFTYRFVAHNFPQSQDWL